MEEVGSALVTVERGLEGDHKGARFPRRQITVLARDDWERALGALASAGRGGGELLSLSWTVRRANLLVVGVDLPKGRGGIIEIGPVLLEVTGQTSPCARMDEAQAGLLKALATDWRGGITCRVLRGGRLSIGDAVGVMARAPQRQFHLPG